MLNEIRTSVSDAVAAVYQAFMLPGELLIAVVDKIAPQAVAVMTFGNGGTVILFILALLSWTLIVVLGLMVSRFCRNLAWQASALVRTAIHRTQSWLAHLKTKLVWQYRRLFPHKHKSESHVSQTEFDEIDIAVLRSVSERGPGFALSAPELAEKFSLRPAQIQSRLEKLRQSNMLRTVIGTTEGFENYGLTESGLAFVSMWQRQQAAG